MNTIAYIAAIAIGLGIAAIVMGVAIVIVLVSLGDVPGGCWEWME